MKADKPFRKSFVVAAVFAVLLALFPKGGSADIRSIPFYLAVSLPAALITGAWVFFQRESWTTRRIAVSCLCNAMWIATAIVLVMVARGGSNR